MVEVMVVTLFSYLTLWRAVIMRKRRGHSFIFQPNSLNTVWAALGTGAILHKALTFLEPPLIEAETLHG